MSVCEHDKHCPGFGWEHDAGVTGKQREDLGLPPGPLSMKRAKRAMRAHRKRLREEEERRRWDKSWANDLFMRSDAVE